MKGREKTRRGAGREEKKRLMRKRDREIVDFDAVVRLLRSCDTIRLGLHGGEYPYVVPLSFGMEVCAGRIVLYFHGAGEGYKHDLIAADNRVCVEADILRGYRPTENSVTADYKSVIGFGVVERVRSFEERVKGLQLLLDHCGTPGYSAEECAAAPHTVVYKITLHRVTGKQRFFDGDDEGKGDSARRGGDGQ